MEDDKIDDSVDRHTAAVTSLFEAFAHRNRRRVFVYLREADGERSRAELASLIAVEDSDDSDGSGTPALDDDIRRIELSLHHRHLPALERANLIEYRPEQGRVSLRLDGSSAEQYLHEPLEDLLAR